MRTCASCRRRRKRKPATNHRSAAGRPSLSRGRGAGRADPDEGVQYRQALRRAGHGRFLTAAQEARDLIRRDYPRIAARAKAEGGAIFWGDGTGLRCDDVRGSRYAPRGRTPEVRVNHKRAGLGLVSAVTNKGELRWMVLDGAVKAPSLLRFLARLVREADRKVFLVLDRLPVHRSAKLRAWLAGREAEIEVFYLPGYSPELNPDEGVDGDLKQAVTRKAPARSKAQLKRAVIGHMRRLSKLLDRVRSFFGHRTFRYAA